jgi:hypothetical protein
MNQVKNADNKKEWEPIVILFRKLREGVFATNWSNGDYTFAIKGDGLYAYLMLSIF